MFTVKESSDVFDTDIIKEAIKYVEDLVPTYEKLQRYYDGEHDIIERAKSEDVLANTRTVVNHASYITDINTGFMVGKAIQYDNPSNEFDKIKEAYDRQEIEFEDNSIAEDLSKFGVAYEINFIDEKVPYSKVVSPKNCVVIYDDSFLHRKIGAVIFTSKNGDSYEDIKVYSLTKRKQFSGKKDVLKTIGEEELHGFLQVPIVEYINNQSLKGDYKDVIYLINAYNTLQSDRINDKQQLVAALLLFYGMGLEDEQLEKAKASRVISKLPKDAKVEYLTKQLDEVSVDVLRASIEADIHKISKTPNLSDKEFAGNSSGVAIVYKLLAFFKNISKKERYFRKGLMDRLQLYSEYFKILGGADDKVLETRITFTHEIPKNDYEVSQMLLNLWGKVDAETLIGQLSFIDDPTAVIEKVGKEQEELLKTSSIMFGEDKPNE